MAVDWESYDWGKSQWDEGMMILARDVVEMLGCEVPHDKMIDLMDLLGSAVNSYISWLRDDD